MNYNYPSWPPFKPVGLWTQPGKGPCTSPSHNPPTHLFVRPGEQFIHRCGCCGAEFILGGDYVVY